MLKIIYKRNGITVSDMKTMFLHLEKKCFRGRDAEGGDLKLRAD